MTQHAQQAFVRPDMLRPNPWNTNVVTPENEQKIENSLLTLGTFRPITVRELEDGGLEILGGEHRWQAAKKLGYTEVPIFNVGRIPDDLAKKIMLADNARYGENDPLGTAQLIKDLGAHDLSNILPWTDADITSMVSAASIALDEFENADQSQLPELPANRPAPSHQLMRFKVPVEDVAWITSLVDQTMREKGLTTEDSLTNAGAALVELLKDKK